MNKKGYILLYDTPIDVDVKLYKSDVDFNHIVTVSFQIQCAATQLLECISNETFFILNPSIPVSSTHIFLLDGKAPGQ